MLNKKDPKGSKNDPKGSKNGQKIGFCPSVIWPTKFTTFFSMPLIEKKSNASENF